MSWEGKVLSADSGDDENVFQCNVQKLQQFATDFGTNEQKIEAYVNLVVCFCIRNLTYFLVYIYSF